jgi:uncharacterized protein YoxC
MNKEELKEQDIRLNKLCFDYQEKEKRIEELEKENTDLKEELKKWKDEWQEQVQKATDEGYARTLQTMQLTKAKEIIKKLISLNRKEWIYSDVREEAEQFLNREVEK